MEVKNCGKASRIAVERHGEVVHVLIRCDSEYDAMMFYDTLGEEMDNGGIILEIKTSPNTELG